jgi:hypothetical protein
MPRRKSRLKYWYQKRRLKHLNVYLTSERKDQLKEIVKAKSDLTVSRYLSRLVEKHIEENLT